MSPRIQILYEDELSPSSPKNFGLHVLVLACVAERLGRDRSTFTHVTAYACKGIGRLLRRCEEPSLLDGYARVLALCDDDEVRPHLKLPATACKVLVTAAIRKRGLDAQRLQPVLLVANLETVLDAIAEIRGQDRLLGKPRPTERERILLSFVHRGTPEQLRELTRRVVSFGYLVDKLERAIIELKL